MRLAGLISAQGLGQHLGKKNHWSFRAMKRLRQSEPVFTASTETLTSTKVHYLDDWSCPGVATNAEFCAFLHAIAVQNLANVALPFLHSMTTAQDRGGPCIPASNIHLLLAPLAWKIPLMHGAADVRWRDLSPRGRPRRAKYAQRRGGEIFSGRTSAKRRGLFSFFAPLSSSYSTSATPIFTSQPGSRGELAPLLAPPLATLL